MNIIMFNVKDIRVSSELSRVLIKLAASTNKLNMSEVTKYSWRCGSSRSDISRIIYAVMCSNSSLKGGVSVISFISTICWLDSLQDNVYSPAIVRSTVVGTVDCDWRHFGNFFFNYWKFSELDSKFILGLLFLNR